MILSSCTKEEKIIRLGTMPTYSAAIYAVGIEQGFFDEAGIPLELTVFRSAIERDGAATAGQLDGFMTDMMGAINLSKNGFDFVMTSTEYEDFGIMTHSGYATNVLADIAQAKVGIAENTVTEYIADTYLTQTIEKVNIVAIPDRLGAMMSQELDLAVFPQPFIGIVEKNGGKAMVSTAELDFQPVVLVFSKAYISANKKEMKAFYEAYDKTIAYMKETSYDTYKKALITYGLATEETVDGFKLPLDHYGLNGISEENYQQISSWMIKKGIISETIPYDSIKDTTFVD
jgi:NitT/TauT family transport system substrate-binding protein